MRKSILAVLLAALVLPACASAGGSASDGPRRSRDVITQAEIVELGPQILTAMDAVQQLRPHFLRERTNPTVGGGAAQSDPVVVYVNGIRRGGIRELTGIRANQVESIRYIRPTDAQTRFGNNHGSGALDVTLIGGA